ncbi:MAG TPA: hypothetical protein VJI75_05000 [Candidatus Nanoarchaeia archaeon]|nr:hypothetical protein [Candidatus Nanoarchaeia archaeon]
MAEADVSAALTQLRKSKEFTSWHKHNSKSFLSHVFFMIGDNDCDCQAGFYDGASDTITTFEIKDPVIINKAEKAFKKEEDSILAIDESSIKLPLSEALTEANALQKKKYSSELPVKRIAILQNLHPYGLIYNMTFVTQGFKTLNIKIDAGTGKIVQDHIVNLFEFEKKN